MNEAGDPELAWVEGCSCGEVHLASREVAGIIATAGPTVMVTVPGHGAWIIPRIYIAAHGLKYGEVASAARHYGWEKTG